MGHDSELVQFARSVLCAASEEFGDQPVGDPDPRNMYTETHWALAALLLYLLDRNDGSLLDVAVSRLLIFDKVNASPTFFNALAICLAAIIARRGKIQHFGLQSVLDRLLTRTRGSRHAAYDRFCGNNMYLQQVSVDMFLLPLALEKAVTGEGVSCLLAEFRKYQTAEGFFYDLPRSGTQQERLCPPTYIMKDLFLAGLCHKLQPMEGIAKLVQSGMISVLPLLTGEGNFSYFGRTDNSPFAAGLTIFNLRQAAQLCPERRLEFEEACRFAETYYKTFPKTTSGLLQCNRFADERSPQELVYSRDDYAYIGQYSLSSCAYALLGCYWFPVTEETRAFALPQFEKLPYVVESKDLGLVKLSGPGRELFLRTGTEITSWDRRYLGPTILRYKIGNRLLIGAISRTLATDYAVRTDRPVSRLQRAFEFFRHRFLHGWEMLDGTSVGFLPVLRDGFSDYLPSKAISVETSRSFVRSRHHMVRLCVRGFQPCLIEFFDLVRRNIARLAPRSYVRPMMTPVDSIKFSRDVYLEKDRCHIKDRVWGDLKGKSILFSVRCCPRAFIEVQGLHERQSVLGWGSDGRQELKFYEERLLASEFSYQFVISTLPGDSR